MPRIAYIQKRFNFSSYQIINHANRIIDEFTADGFNLTLRQLYYQFVAQDLIENSQKAYKRLGMIINDARLAGLIDWHAIEDRTRNLKGHTHWLNPGQIIEAAARGFRLDHWDNQEYRLEVWVEKEALIGVIGQICAELDVDFFACRGYVSQSEMWSAARRLSSYQYKKQRPVVIHLGDHDPSGIDMTRDIMDRFDLFKPDEIDLLRIALNMDQIEEHQPPPNPAKITDSRYNTYRKKYGSDSWELDALNPNIIRDLISDKVKEYRDEEKYAYVLAQEQEYLHILDRVAKNWELL